MQPLLRGFDPGFKPVPVPTRRLDQHDPSCLHEQDAQVAIAALGYPAQDGAVPGGHLSRYKPEPSGKVAALRKRLARTDRSDHRAGDDRANAGHAHQPLAGAVSVGQGLDLGRELVDATVEPTPVVRQGFDDTRHARRENLASRSQDTGELGAEETLTLPHGDPTLQEKRTDLIDDAGALTDQPR